MGGRTWTGGGEARWREGLSSIRALEILAAKVERLWRVGSLTSRVGVLEWSLDSGGGPWPWVGLFLAGGIEERLWGLPLLR